eukprot:gene10976-biopygen15823
MTLSLAIPAALCVPPHHHVWVMTIYCSDCGHQEHAFGGTSLDVGHIPGVRIPHCGNELGVTAAQRFTCPYAAAMLPGRPT